MGPLARLGARVARIPPVWLVVASILAVQVGSSVAKILLGVVAPVQVAALRLTFGALILILAAPPRLGGRRWRDWAVVVGYGACLAVMNLAFYAAIERIPIGTAVTIEFLGPLAVAVFGSQRARDLVWALLAALGVALLGFDSSRFDLVGAGFALLAATGWSGYIVLARGVGRSWEGISGLTVATLVGAVSVVPLALHDGGELWRPWIVGAGAGVGLMSTALPYGLELVALRKIRPGVFGILMSLEPAAAALAALVILQELLSPVELIAMALVIAASVGATRAGARLSDGEASESVGVADDGEREG